MLKTPSGAGLGLMVEPEAREAARQKQAVILNERVSNLDLSVLYLKNRSNEPIVKEIVKAAIKVWSQPSHKNQATAEIIEPLPGTMSHQL